MSRTSGVDRGVKVWREIYRQSSSERRRKPSLMLIGRMLHWGSAMVKKARRTSRSANPPSTVLLSSVTAGEDCDPVPTRTAAWLNRRDRRDAMIRQWQELESTFLIKARMAKLDADYETSDLPEACAMRILDQRINAAFPEMSADAAAILALPTMSARGAIAKIELGLPFSPLRTHPPSDNACLNVSQRWDGLPCSRAAAHSRRMFTPE